MKNKEERHLQEATYSLKDASVRNNCLLCVKYRLIVKYNYVVMYSTVKIAWLTLRYFTANSVTNQLVVLHLLTM